MMNSLGYSKVMSCGKRGLEEDFNEIHRKGEPFEDNAEVVNLLMWPGEQCLTVRWRQSRGNNALVILDFLNLGVWPERGRVRKCTKELLLQRKPLCVSVWLRKIKGRTLETSRWSEDGEKMWMKEQRLGVALLQDPLLCNQSAGLMSSLWPWGAQCQCSDSKRPEESCFCTHISLQYMLVVWEFLF